MFKFYIIYLVNLVLSSNEIILLNEYINTVIKPVNNDYLNVMYDEETLILIHLDTFLADKLNYEQITALNCISKLSELIQVQTASFIMKTYYTYQLNKDDALQQFNCLLLFCTERRKEIQNIYSGIERNPDEPKETFKKYLKDVIKKLDEETALLNWENLAIINPDLYSQHPENNITEYYCSSIAGFIDMCDSLAMLQLLTKILLVHNTELIIYCNKISELKANL